MKNQIFIGTAGWSIPSAQAEHFPGEGTHLQRYAQVLNAAEINTSFYRPHQPRTYAKWAASVPGNFHFAVKIPKQITHEKRLRDAEILLDNFLSEFSNLGQNLGPLLLQLPPSESFNLDVAAKFFDHFRNKFTGAIVCEPRHLTWFSPQAEKLLIDFQIARAATDPAISPRASTPGGWNGVVYYRLHGAPKMYYSNYSDEFLSELNVKLHQTSEYSAVWCIFDNTAEFAATANALTLLNLSRSLL